MKDILKLTRTVGSGKIATLEEYLIDDSIRIYGVEWTGQNFYSILALVGKENTPGMEKGFLNIYGRALQVGDFVYTTVPKSQFDYVPARGSHYNALPPEEVFVIEQGTWQFIEAV
jgi:hypothetical protein